MNATTRRPVLDFFIAATVVALFWAVMTIPLLTVIAAVVLIGALIARVWL